MIARRLLAWALATGCSDRAAGGESEAEAEAESESESEGEAEAEAEAESEAEAEAEAEGECPAPPVLCRALPPECPAGSFPEAAPCPGGSCPGRCWTGACAPCGVECQSDQDCALVGHHGCCGPAGDCAGGCFWAIPTYAQVEEPCYFPAGCPIPAAPPGCDAECSDDQALCEACPHCGPDGVRCEGGACVEVWSYCEPDCACD